MPLAAVCEYLHYARSAKDRLQICWHDGGHFGVARALYLAADRRVVDGDAAGEQEFYLFIRARRRRRG